MTTTRTSPTRTATSPPRWATPTLAVLLLSGFLVSVIHYTDNTVRYDDYVQGASTPVARWMIPTSWVLFTGAALLAWRAWGERRWSRAAAFTGAYSVSGLISPAHFTSVAPADFDTFQLTFITLDTLVGVGLLAFAVWLALAGPVARPDRSVD